MKKRLLSSVLAFLLLCMAISPAAVAQDENTVIIVAVGIVPEAAFVEAVAGDLAHVLTLIPSGYSPANYQPTAMEMRQLSDAAVYFTLQMPTEQANILPKVKEFNADLRIVDLREAVLAACPLLNTDGEEITELEGQAVDPHLWLSPKRAVVMVRAIADELSAIDADHQAVYQANAAAYIAQIESLDADIQEKAAALPNKSFIIYHGAYGYFAHDYGLTMIAIQIAGKQATAEEMRQVIDAAMENHITTVFYQDEFDDNQAATVAEEIGGAVAKTSPLSVNYIQGLEDFISALAQLSE